MDRVETGLAETLSELMRRLYPITRSITGPGVRETLAILSETYPIQVNEVATGTPVFDWIVPREWSVREAWVKDPSGRTVIDFKDHNLHVLNYSAPIEGRFSLEELKPHLYSLPNQPDLIPYRTSYYNENWGFCLTDRQLQSLTDGVYEVKIDSTLANGSLTYGEIVIPGEIEDEILISTHTCHPSLANDNLSGLLTSVNLAKRVAAKPHRHTYHFLFIPGTIGSITWLAQNEARAQRIKHGLVLTGMGDGGPFTYKKSRRGDAVIDRVAPHVLGAMDEAHEVIDFYPYGYDERQFCSPGFNLPVGRISRTPHGEYPEYHTSGDNLEFVQPDQIVRAIDVVEAILDTADRNKTLKSLNPKCEPQLGKHGLYRKVAGQTGQQTDELALLWVMSAADGSQSVLDIAEKAKMPFARIAAAADRLEQHALVEAVQPA